MPADTEVCEACKKLVQHLPAVFKYFLDYSQERDELEGNFTATPPIDIFKLDLRFVDRQGLTCGLCRRLWVSRVQRRMSNLPDERKYLTDCEEHEESEDTQTTEGNCDILWVCPYLECMDRALSGDGYNIRKTSSAGLDFLILVVAPEWQKFRNATEMIQPDFGGSQPSFTTIQRLSTSKDLLYQPRRISPDFDENLASKWLQACKTHHARDSCGLSLQIDAEIILIDCHKCEIRPSRSTYKYAALSYVWGDAKQPPLCPEGKLPHDVSAVIKDAMTVTKAIGLQYLWVDLYCIDQEDEVAKKKQISHMSTIYEQAEITIVASCGDNAAYGLPGVGRHRKPTRGFQHGEYDIALVNDPYMNPPELSAWNTRGWTLQEAWLSRRILCFTESQCYWECRGTCISEDLDHNEQVWTECRFENPQKHLKTGPRSRNNFRRLNDGNQRWARYVYETHEVIKQFNMRELSLDSDALIAISGVLSVAHRDLFTAEESQNELRPRAILGLPIFLGRDNEDPIRKVTLIAALTWHHKDSEYSSEWLWKAKQRWPQRRRNFSSWTWAGWKGRTAFDNCWAQWRREWNVDFCITNVEIFSAGKSVQLSDFQSTENTAKLRFCAPNIPSNWLSFQKEDDVIESDDNDQYWCLLKGRKMRFFPSERDYHPSHISRDLQSGTSVIVLIGFIKNRQALLWLLRREDNAFIRSGIIAGFSEESESGEINLPILNHADCEESSARELSDALADLCQLNEMPAWEIC